MLGSKEEAGQTPAGPAAGAPWVSPQQANPQEGQDRGKERERDLAGARRRPLSCLGPSLGLIQELRGFPLVHSNAGVWTTALGHYLSMLSSCLCLLGGGCIGVTYVLDLFAIKFCFFCIVYWL